MVIRLLVAFALLAPLAAVADAPERIAPATFVAWEPSGLGHAVTAAGLLAVNTTRRCPPRTPHHEAPSDHCFIPAARITPAGGGAAIELTGAPKEVAPYGYTARLAIGPLAHGRAGAILTTYSGGAHCCEAYVVAWPGPGGWRRVNLTYRQKTLQGSLPQTEFNYGLEKFPTDLDGDGAADFVLGDDAFAYAFADYADSWAPPVILTIVGGAVADVSTRPAFRPLFEADMAKTKAACVSPDPQRSPNGACAAYAADAARLGRLAEAWPVVLAHYDHRPDAEGLEACTAPYVSGGCPAGHQVRYPDYPAALRDFLVRTGYLTR